MKKKFVVKKKKFQVKRKEKTDSLPMSFEWKHCDLKVRSADDGSFFFSICVDGHMWIDGRLLREMPDANRIHLFPHLQKELGWPYDKKIFKKLEAFDKACREREKANKDGGKCQRLGKSIKSRKRK